MTTNEDILEALSRLNSVGSGYTPKGLDTSGLSGFGSKYKKNYGNISENIDWEKAFTPSKDKKKKKKSKVNLWDVLTGTLGQPGGLITNTTHNYMSGKKNQMFDKDDPMYKRLLEKIVLDSLPAAAIKTVGQAAKNGGKKQLSNWKDGELSWGNVPGIGFLNGTDKGYKRGHDILDDFSGMKDGWKKTAAGIGIDVVADPLTYLTGGAGMATKLGKVAELKKIAELQKGMGITGKFKKSDDFLAAAETSLKSKYADKYPHLVDSMVSKKMGEITNQIKTARNTTYNANINKWGVSVPFSNKATAAIGNVSKRNPLYRSEAALGSEFKHVASNLIKEATGNDAAKIAQVTAAVLNRYKVGSLDELSKTHLDDLHAKLTPVIEKSAKGLPDANTTQKIVSEVMPQQVFDDIMTKFTKDNVPWKDVQKQLDEVLAQTAHDPKLRAGMGSHLAEMVSTFWRTKKAKNFSGAADARKAESMAWASRFLKETDEVKKVQTTVDEVFPTGSPATKTAKNNSLVTKAVDDMGKNPFNEMMDAHTKAGHWLRGKNPFDARTLATGSKFVDSMADHISDGSSSRIGGAAKYAKSLEDIKKFIKGNDISPTDMKHAIYHIEKHAPDSLGKDWVPSDKVKKLADMIKPVIKKFGDDEQAAGVLSSSKKNYFPHVVNQSPETRKAMEDFAKRHPELSELNNLKKGNKFDKARKSFQTLAQRDNYIVKIEKAIQKETDADTIESLRKQLDHVADMFDTDVVSALTRRIKEGVRAKSMKAMQGELQKFGMMKSNPKDIISDTKGLTKIDKATAKKLGLDEGEHYIQPQVLEGMKRVDEIFTDQGMNKAVRQLNAFSDIWRTLVTHYKPSHYVNNVIGNVMTNMAAGVKTKDYISAGKLIRGYRKGTLTKAQAKLMDKAYDHNVISGGFLHDGHRSFQFDEKRGLEKVADKVLDNKVINKVRAYGEVGDDITRLANYINGMNKFGSSAKAAKQVREYLFNYNELTNLDRGMRTVVPFWNWMKRNIPLQVKLLMEQPKFAMNVERFKNVFNDGRKGEEWQKETGIKISPNYYTSLPSPTHDLNTLLNPGSALGSMNPAARMALETTMNKKMFTGAPISYGHDEAQAKDLPEYFAKNFGITGNAYDFASGNKGVGESLINLFKNITPIRE